MTEFLVALMRIAHAVIIIVLTPRYVTVLVIVLRLVIYASIPMVADDKHVVIISKICSSALLVSLSILVNHVTSGDSKIH